MAIYFFYGNEDYNIELAIKEKKKLLDKSFASMNFKTYNNPPFADLISILRSQAMMFGNLLIVINCENYFTKIFEDRELKEIENALNNNTENIDVIFVATLDRNENKKIDSRKKLFKIFSKFNVQEFSTFKTYKIEDISNWIKKHAKTKEIQLNNDAVLTLIEQIGNNLRNFDTELDKLKLLAYPEKIITKKMVRDICISNEDLFNFAEMVMVGEKDKAILEFRKLLDKKHALEILSALQTMLRKWILLKLNSAKSTYELSKITGLHEYVIKLNLSKMKNHSLKDLVSLKQNLTNAEYNLKSGNSIDIEGEMENAIMR